VGVWSGPRDAPTSNLRPPTSDLSLGTTRAIVPRMTHVPLIASVPDPALGARVLRRTPLHYDAGADPSIDRPAHVRAGSSMAWVGERLVVVQDDANFLAVVDPHRGAVWALALDAGESGLRQFDDVRGNKAHKLDLEACVVVPGAAGSSTLLALGSGSTARRESVLVASDLTGPAPSVALRQLPALYAALRAEPAFAGSELNVEGALFVAGRGAASAVLRLFGRGNGAARDALLPRNATCDLDWPALDAHLAAPAEAPPPLPRDVVQYDLGAIDGVPLGFTDAALLSDGSILYAAAAEASPDVTRDGLVAGSVLGVIRVDSRGRPATARHCVVRDGDGSPLAAKVEGVTPSADSPSRCWVVVDVDDPGKASELCEVELGGPWTGSR